MSSYRQILYQIIIHPKDRKHTLCQEHIDEFCKYIWGIIKNNKCYLYRINGITDHIHILSDLHPTIALADYVKDIKVASSKWMKSSGKFPDFTHWSDGYGAFTYSFNDKERLIEYIKNQQEHHKKFSFIEEYKQLLKEHNIEINERYLP